MDHEEYYEDIHEFFEDFPERFILTSEELDPATYEEYIDHKQRIHDEYHTEDSILQESEQLFQETLPISRKKAILILLSQVGTVNTYRILEHYVKQANTELRAWSLIALYECRMRLESDLLDTEVGLISTGLGGEAHRLRYIVIVGLVFSELNDEDTHCVQEELHTICQEHDSKLEHLHFHEQYLQASLMISMEVAVSTVIEDSIDAVNTKRLLLHQAYFVTNVKTPDQEDIQAYLQEIRKR